MSDSTENRTRIPCRLQSRRPQLVTCVMLVATVALTDLTTETAKAQSGFIGPAGSSLNQSSGLGAGERVLVLRTGRVMKGRIKKISTGWLVSTNRGNAVIPFEQVHFDADDLNEAYLLLRIQSGEPTVASHLRLAEWCLSQDILAEAARELRDALAKDSSNETARLMLNRVDNEIRRRTPPEPEPERPTDVVILTEKLPEVEDTEVRSLAGLSPETAREFVASIQPLLLNKCGNARCHGSVAENNFQLTRLRSGSSNSRIVSERNLAAVLNDLQPADSNTRPKILDVLHRPHAGQTIFNGRYGAVQMQTLQAWMNNAARELSIELRSTQQTAFSNRIPATSTPTSIVANSDLVRPSSLNEAQNEHSSAVTGTTTSTSEDFVNVEATTEPTAPSNSRPGNTSELPPDSATSPTPLNNVQRLLQEARQHVRKSDAFDPEDFNRRFAGSRTQ
ncbi:MAG: hypothetical protein O2945_03465 [Planctomycetota bacterium]|nr:hypothetical protein [Planctomycetota bacterium]MDA0918113.1 hypothetical protein [Planctomycetota bacterium]